MFERTRQFAFLAFSKHFFQRSSRNIIMLGFGNLIITTALKNGVKNIKAAAYNGTRTVDPEDDLPQNRLAVLF